MYEPVRASLQRWINCSESQFDAFLTIARPQEVTYKRKEFILREGETCRYLYFINKGCIRYFYNVDGEEKTGQFFFENGWYSDLESFLTGEPSWQNIQALEPTQLLLISRDNLYRLYEQVPVFERFGRLLIEQSFIGLRTKNKHLTSLSPEERYLKLIEERPKVIQRVSLKYIASYLGVQPESLSRIRKRLFEQK
jgi:CRP/FNR family transcriptional regulator, anaerobic regulatory protein